MKRGQSEDGSRLLVRRIPPIRLLASLLCYMLDIANTGEHGKMPDKGTYRKLYEN
jgi:hypothetical protein